MKTMIRCFAWACWGTVLMGTLASEPDAAPGLFLDVDGRRVHYLETRGQGATVVLEAGGGVFSAFWYGIQDRLADELGVRVISYDRAGLGWSDPRPGDYTLDADVDDLKMLIDELAGDGPVILVGHSLGGFVAQRFANRYPDDVQALLLLDPNTSEFFAARPDTVARIERDGAEMPVRGMKRVLLRLSRGAIVSFFGDASWADQAWIRYRSDQHQRATGAPLRVFSSLVRTVAASPLPDVSTIVISRGLDEHRFPWKTRSENDAWREGHANLARSVPRGEHWRAAGAKHGVIDAAPDIVIEAVMWLLSQMKT